MPGRLINPKATAVIAPRIPQTIQFGGKPSVNSAKEAFSKALGTGFRGAVNFSDISILNNELGAPYVQLSGKLAVQIKNQRLKCHVSISDTDSSAMAMVVIEKE